MDAYRLRQRNGELVGELEQVNADLEWENVSLKREIRGAPDLSNLIGESPVMLSLREVLGRAIDSDAPVVLAGETGTGKEVVARAIHFNGPRRRHRFVPLNCAAMPESMLETELFGHVEGAFTGAIRDRPGLFEEAHRGTLFLDEVGDMPLPMQVRLLRVLEQGEIRRIGSNESSKVDVRIVSASHKDLREEVRAGRFREDLYFRLHVIGLELPPLRERTGDVALLARHFFHKYNERSGRRLTGLTDDAIAALAAHGFPGNVRELENEIQRGIALATPGGPLDAEALSSDLSADQVAAGTLRQRLLEVERRLIVEGLQAHDGNRTRSARALGISVRALQQKIRSFKIDD
jgi:transcriptional regulator with PAS, ATPase and Fis domain